MTPLPPLAELLLHAGPMRLLERAVAHDGERTVRLALPAAHTLSQQAGGEAPSWLGIEYMAQYAAARGDTLAFDCAVEDPAGGPPLVEGRLDVLRLREIPAPAEGRA